jgi:phosphatidylethanolamine-binding protein (PEBP) family uncharacterized protein
MLQVQIGNYQIQNGQQLNVDQARQGINVTWPANNQYNTLIIYDISAPHQNHPIHSPFVHFLEINIPNADLANGNVLSQYTPPNPPPNSGIHTYVLDLYQQNQPIQMGALQQRENFPLAGFIQQANLQLIDRFRFNVPAAQNQFDGYAMPQTQNLTDAQQNLPQNLSLLGQEYIPSGPWVNPDLPENIQKYCRCVAEVAAREPDECTREERYYQRVQGRRCANPYAVCHSTIPGVGNPDCTHNYIFENMPDNILRGYLSEHKIPLPEPFNRQQALQNVSEYINQKEFKKRQFE